MTRIPALIILIEITNFVSNLGKIQSVKISPWFRILMTSHIDTKLIWLHHYTWRSLKSQNYSNLVKHSHIHTSTRTHAREHTNTNKYTPTHFNAQWPFQSKPYISWILRYVPLYYLQFPPLNVQSLQIPLLIFQPCVFSISWLTGIFIL